MKRIFLIVLDSVGIGEMPDADQYNDAGSNTLKAASESPYFSMEHMRKLGCFNIDGVQIGEKEGQPEGSYARMTERSRGKDTTIGHWEIAGIVSEKPLPVYPQGFPDEILRAFSQKTGRGILCNRPYSGTEVIRDYGEEHMKTGKLIVYTSADSVFQIAAHEDVIPVKTLYEYCGMARELLSGEHNVGRVIARPFTGEPGSFVRTARRHDFSVKPPKTTMLDQLKESGYQVLAVGKINDIFAGEGITEFVRTENNADGIDKMLAYMEREFEGLCFVNLVDYDMLYGHRNDVDGYAKALTYFDSRLPEILDQLKEEDILMITADHGCDPSTPSTDHSREYTPFVIYGKPVKGGVNLKTRESFADIGASVLDYFRIKPKISGKSMLDNGLLLL
ncbi:Phosphopentomutase [uncultured Roseburia sp.]|uniref:Phosphopentomutase n=1 Tax=Brotonthovivens ammoniilytica TaxID=2981725 RepID=A0ABT2TGG1_9FIRM|nr:phosphopentomutase [Brotonthovivens ammoniilytica]MCU6760976.1 phosphopentomutase [Brotonthovivens ammoniilytica]SCI15146.1 Phosphopentomutase [uncultured Roseburia sp.]